MTHQKATKSFIVICAAICLSLPLLAPQMFAEAALRIPIPKRSKPTPVQKLNGEGVNALRKHHFEKAKEDFYHAYLLDPDDPFTLNNLGYISELEGDVDRAQRYYELAEKNSSGAMVANSNVSAMKGQAFSEVVEGVKDRNFKPNRANVEAIRLLSHGRPQEAEDLLQKSLALNPHDPFTLNNLGYAKENEGELKDALKYYQAAAKVNSKDPVIVTANRSWRGQPISKIAARNAKSVERELQRRETSAQQVARLNLRGVSALNRNDIAAARGYFQQAYKLNPEDGFTLNNMGYLAELDGDRETADEFYAKAHRAERSNDKVTVSTQRELEGLNLGSVAGINDQKVENRIEAAAELRRREGGPIQLKRRNGSPVTEPSVPQSPPGSEKAPQPEPPPPPATQPQLTPRAPSPYSPEPPQMPAPQLPEPPSSGQPSGPPPAIQQPQVQPSPQTAPPPPQTTVPQAAPAPQTAPQIQPAPQGTPPQTTPPSSVQPQPPQ
ncbi:MAG TPA: tetratricopeptide repeat protein [Terriglobales bacterium]|nr:tetratricopeptide repeat protein [Terriglobales bacterium]